MRNTFGLRVGAAAIGAASALAILPGAAGAAFDAGHAAQCQGTEAIRGAGASFQSSAHMAWGARVVTTPAGAFGFGYASASAGGCPEFRLVADGGSREVYYNAGGSGAGRTVVGADARDGRQGIRDTAFHFGASDEAPTAADVAAANAGADRIVGNDDDAILHSIPVAQSSVAIAVRLPDGCTVPVADRKITKLQLEGAFSGSSSADTWGEVLPSISGAGCAAKPVKRVVRSSDSGTTFALKSFLVTVNAANWPSSLANRDWPNETPANIDKSNGTNNSNLLDTLTLQTENGGIGYSDLGTARAKGYDATAAGATRFWLDVERSPSVYLSPADQAVGATGANCRSVRYIDTVTGLLPKTTDSWDKVSGAGTQHDYPICSLTFALVWEDMAKANVNRPADKPAYTQGHARAVKDYIGYILNQQGGQARLAPAGYQALPVDPVTGTATPGTVLAIAQEGLAKLTWNGQPVPVDPDPPVVDPPVIQPPVIQPPVIQPPVNQPPVNQPPVNQPTPQPAKVTARVSRVTAASRRGFTLTARPSAAGRVTATATIRVGKRTVTVARGSATAKKAGNVRVTLKATAAGRKALKAGRKTRVSFRLSFTAKDGGKASASRTGSIKIKR